MSSRKLLLIWPALLLFALFKDEALPAGISLAPWSPGQKVVVLDPGHAGHDPGAMGPSGLPEKAVTLALAQKIKEILSGAYAVHLTRNGDYWIDIEKRTAVANHLRAHIFISLHAGGSFHHKARGMAIFYYGPDTSQRSTSPRENDHISEAGEKLYRWDHIQSKHTEKSELLANFVHKQLLARLNPMDRGIHEAPCLVLRGADMAAILVEIAYLCHPAEEKNLKDPGVISAVAEAICEGIRDFFRQTNGCTNHKGMIQKRPAAGRGAAW